MSARIFSRTVKSVSELFGPHLKSQALNAMSRQSRSQEQLLRAGCHGKDPKEAALVVTRSHVILRQSVDTTGIAV